MSGPLALVYPVMAQVLITFVLMLLTARARLAALRAHRVRFSDIALSNTAWPDDVRKVGNSMHNQFETPILFYVLCGVATFIGDSGFLMVLFAWLYVVTRIIHAAIHVTSNDVPQRFYVFVFGVAFLMAMWVALALHLMVA